MPDAAPNPADLFEIVRTTRSMRRLQPDPVPNELIRKILEAGVCAPSGGNMQRWRFLVIRDPQIKRAWDEQVAPRYRAGEPAPGMSRERFLRLLDAAEYLAAHIHGVSRMDCPLPRRSHPDPHVRLVDPPSGSEYAAGGKSAWPRRDPDDAVLAACLAANAN